MADTQTCSTESSTLHLDGFMCWPWWHRLRAGRALRRAAGGAVRRSACCSGSRGCGRSTRTSTGATSPTAAPRATCTASWSGVRTCRTACCTRRARRTTPCLSARGAPPGPLLSQTLRALHGLPRHPCLLSSTSPWVRDCSAVPRRAHGEAISLEREAREAHHAVMRIAPGKGVHASWEPGVGAVHAPFC